MDISFVPTSYLLYSVFSRGVLRTGVEYTSVNDLSGVSRQISRVNENSSIFGSFRSLNFVQTSQWKWYTGEPPQNFGSQSSD